METESNRPSRRERKGFRSLGRPSEPPGTILPDPIAPELDTKKTIARSKSRYKGSRPQHSRSTSTPSVSAIPSSKTASHALSTRLPQITTTDPSYAAASNEYEDEATVPLSQANTRFEPPLRQHSVPETQKPNWPNIHDEVAYNEPATAADFNAPDRLSGEQSRRRHRHGPRAHHHNSWRTKPDSGDARHDFVTNRDAHLRTLPPRPAMVQKKSFSEKIAGFIKQPQSAVEAKEQLKSIISHPIPIQLDQSSSAADFDAPKSAVNAGDRTVRVKYKEFKVPITIVPSTTPIDVIRSVADQIALPIHQDSAVVLESFKQLGLERPLRKYEHIRDVLNSWDDDAQNTLIIEPSATGGHDDDLDINNVPVKSPADSSFYMYHSQRPGHWDKRTVTLRSDGQVLVAKPSGSESLNICHLSDFDIYIPTARQVKRMKPPRRVCFAVKSQQKSSMFMSTENFVHFFCSNDKDLAKTLYTAVQEWRSWYLVNRMGKGTDQKNLPRTGYLKQATVGVELGRKPTTSAQTSHRARADLPAQRILPARPPDTTNKTRTHQAQPPTVTSQHAYPTTTQKEGQPGSYPRSPPTVPADDAPFSHGGLLGRTYTQRKNSQQTNEVRPPDPPSQIPASSPSPVKTGVTDLNRTSSQRQKVKPLVDLTPRYEEPPQHTRKGRGVTPGHIPAGGLIDIATSPEVAIPIPPTTSWRRPGTSSGNEASPVRNRS
ncbi:MAG: hypothetical protein Q9174_000350 [Haloplaca sp. 1 TL-2023]